MHKVESAVRRVKRSITTAFFLRAFVIGAAAWCFLWGGIVLVLRIAFGITSVIPSLSGAIGLLIVWAVARVIAHRSTPTTDQIRAKLDAINEDGGMLMTSAEVNIPGWSDHIALQNIPRARWKDNRALLALIVGCTFVAVATLAPLPSSESLLNTSLDIDGLIDDLQAQVELLEEQEIIEEDRAEAVIEKLEQIAEEAALHDPMKTWEALDHIADSVDTLASEAAEDILSSIEDTTTLEALADSLQDAFPGIENEAQLTQAMQELAELMLSKELMDKLEGILSPELAKALQTQTLSPEQLKELSESLKKCNGQQLDKMCKLCEASLVDSEMLNRCKSVSSDAEAALQAFLDKEGENAECLSIAAQGNLPGKGGVSRGRGDAPLTWTDGTDESGVGFVEEMLPTSELGGMEQSTLLGITRGAPEPLDAAAATPGGALEETAAGGGAAHKQRVLPQHKQAVMRYFNRGDSKDEPDTQ